MKSDTDAQSMRQMESEQSCLKLVEVGVLRTAPVLPSPFLGPLPLLPATKASWVKTNGHRPQVDARVLLLEAKAQNRAEPA